MKINLTPVELIDQLRSWFHPKDRVITLSDEQWISSKRVAWETAVSKNLALPGLVGFWPMSSVQRSTGNVYDISGQGRTLTYNGNPVFSIYNGFTPYAQFDGTGDYFSRADETDLDILGTETIYTAAVRGLTVGGWFWLDTVAAVIAMSKRGAAGQYSWQLTFNSGGNLFRFIITTDGSTEVAADQAFGPSVGRWYFLAGRFVPLTEITSFVGDDILTKVTTTAGIPASIFNSNAAIQINGINGAGNLFTGRASLCFLCANALSDDLILAKYYQERELFQ